MEEAARAVVSFVAQLQALLAPYREQVRRAGGDLLGVVYKPEGERFVIVGLKIVFPSEEEAERFLEEVERKASSQR